MLQCSLAESLKTLLKVSCLALTFMQTECIVGTEYRKLSTGVTFTWEISQPESLLLVSLEMEVFFDEMMAITTIC